MKKIAPFILVIIFLILGFFYSPLEGWLACKTGWKICPPPPKGYSSRGEFKYVKIAGKNIKVELADTPAEHAQGLSGRSGLPEGEGMLFVFDKSGIYPFWMKDMNFAIDIIWLAPSEGGDDRNMKVIYIKKDAKPEDYPQSYNPESQALYVLEVASSFSEKNNLKVGDRVEFLF